MGQAAACRGVFTLVVTSVAVSAADYHSEKAAQAGAPVNRSARVITVIVVVTVVVVIAIVIAAVAVIDRLSNRLLVHAVVTVLADILSTVAITSSVLCVGGYASEAQKGDAKDREHYAAS